MFIKPLRIATAVVGLFATSMLSAYPSGIDIAGPVKASGSGAAAVSYNAFKASSINSYFNTIGFNSPSSAFNPQATAGVSLITDPAVSFNFDANVRAYFISSDAGFNNTLGITSNNSISPSSSKLIFPNASNVPSAPSSDPNSPYSALAQGFYVDVGVLQAGVPLNLFLIANGANGAAQGSVFSNSSLNSDNNVHVKMVQFLGTNYYLVGFEDTLGTGSSDFDYNDLVIALAIVPTPEPSTYLVMGTLLLIGFCIYRKQKRVNFNNQS